MPDLAQPVANLNLAKHSPLLPSFLLEDVFEHSSEGMVILDANRQVLYMNKAAKEMTGYASHRCGEFCGTLFRCQTEGKSALQNDKCFGSRVLTTKAPIDTEMNIETASGDHLIVSVNYSYIPAEDGGSYLLMTLRDITNQKHLEKERRQKEALNHTLQERERLARDLHDGVVQEIAYANMQMKALLDDVAQGKEPDPQLMEKISQVLDNSTIELRQALFDLTFRVTEDLASYIKHYVQEFETRTAIPVHYQLVGTPISVDPAVTSQLAKMIQESMTNIRKHAQARKIHFTVAFSPEKDRVLLSIRDDGCGFDPTLQPSVGHYGMKTMKERCKQLGGTFSLDSAVNKGTSIRIEVPIA
ncbi:histidine kinase [Alicyclobacillus tolerans]|uniref:PAS domain-containing sensor histidine kinase n=1 Tax=Alicyclobacillus tolerans TaxID=90970 RepID=UPI001F013B6A|nr:ATP-binding protein [Alicyclobacillus tolerans]MCF8567211.1 histidine kinase [Alicyclobacillus tolerans]